jgi:glucose-6-phosphate 1-epimerase
MTTSPSTVSAEAPGVRITACPRGAHLMTWTTDGVERLWMSPLSSCGSADAIRGGVPVLFPQFGTFGELAKHGFARTAPWQQVDAPEVPGSASLAFELVDSEETRAVWPHPFRARVEVVASATDLRMGLIVHNGGPEPARFTGGLHSYFAVADPEAWIGGLGGCHAWDGQSTQEPAFTNRLGDRIPALQAQDLVVKGAVAPVVLNDAVLGRLHVAARGFQNRVVWNPGAGHGLPDVAPGDEARFVCIEPTTVVPVTLPGHGTWEGRQHVYLG